jgi:hypothetical protein
MVKQQVSLPISTPTAEENDERSKTIEAEISAITDLLSFPQHIPALRLFSGTPSYAEHA